MKYLAVLVSVFILLFSSCLHRINNEEDEILAQLGDSCVNRLLKKRIFPHPPPPPDIILSFFKDTIKSKIELNRLDTLGFPFKYSVYNFQFNADSSVNDYYKAFDRQNNIRLQYIYDNVIVRDSLKSLSPAIFAESFENCGTSVNEFSSEDVNSVCQTRLNVLNLSRLWDKKKLKDNYKLISDLKPISIQFYRIILNKAKTKGVLIFYFNVWGYTDGFARLDIEKHEQAWSIKEYHWFSVNINEKRWKIK